MKLITILFLFLGMFFANNNLQAQENAPEPRNKIFEKKEKQRAKDRAQAEKELTAHHAKIQGKETRKRMKRNKKKAERMKKGKKADPFWKKWFRK